MEDCNETKKYNECCAKIEFMQEHKSFTFFTCKKLLRWDFSCS